MENDKNPVDASLVEGDGKISNHLEERKNLVNKIILSFQTASQDYNGSESIKEILHFLRSDAYMGRIPYFDITKEFFTADEEMRGQMLTNIENLVEDVCGTDGNAILKDIVPEEKEQDKCREIILKINDHIHLAYIQMFGITERAVKRSKDIFEVEIEDSKAVLGKEIEKSRGVLGREMREEIQSTEKNYIAILGIFASLITVAIGGFNFATKAFEAIGNAENIHNLIGLSTIIGIVLISLSGIMINLIFTIIDKEWKWERVTYPSVGVVAAGIVMYFLSRYC